MGMHWASGFVHRGKRDGGCTQSRTVLLDARGIAASSRA